MMCRRFLGYWLVNQDLMTNLSISIMNKAEVIGTVITAVHISQ
ncbi:hypothetical protein [Peribacillus simplex]|uniref:Uncharacterized protein n=1 Tax=Peribacillus simplex TaxID=1478 RepID=A0AAW7IUF1_9BACI|nr:hypothetical protein [Peribacillus simplex]MDM5453943.1 hypothetical protein [Peribacillus simplex]